MPKAKDVAEKAPADDLVVVPARNENTMFAMAEEYRRVANLLRDGDADEATIADTLEGEQWPLEKKGVAVTYVIREADLMMDNIDAEIERLKALKKRNQTKRDGLMAYVHRCMQVAGLTSLPAGTFTFSVRKNPPSVEILDENAIPPELMNVPEPVAPTPDKKAIAKKLAAGEAVPGARHAMPTYRLEMK